MISIYARLSTLALILPILYQHINSVCDASNIKYDIDFQITRSLRKINSQSVTIHVNTKDRAGYYKIIHSKSEQKKVIDKIPKQ